MHNESFFMPAKRAVHPLALLCACWLLIACTMPTLDTEVPAEATQTTTSRGASAGDVAGDEAAQEVLFTRHREGGIVGFCDDVTVYSDGAYAVESCRSNAEAEPRSGQLTAAQMDTVEAWANTYQAFDYSRRDPATADAMTVSLDFYGVGEEVAAEEQQREVVAFANELFVQSAE